MRGESQAHYTGLKIGDDAKWIADEVAVKRSAGVVRTANK